MTRVIWYCCTLKENIGKKTGVCHVSWFFNVVRYSKRIEAPKNIEQPWLSTNSDNPLGSDFSHFLIVSNRIEQCLILATFTLSIFFRISLKWVWRSGVFLTNNLSSMWNQYFGIDFQPNCFQIIPPCFKETHEVLEHLFFFYYLKKFDNHTSHFSLKNTDVWRWSSLRRQF